MIGDLRPQSTRRYSVADNGEILTVINDQRPPIIEAHAMPVRLLSRRSSLLLPLAAAACGGAPPSYPELRYDYLPPFG